MSTVSSSSPFRAALLRFGRQRSAMVALFALLVVCLLCGVGPKCTGYDANAQDLVLGASEPSAAHWLGTDTLGRDTLTRVMVGGQVSLMIGCLATGVALLLGVSYGLVSGLAGGKVDALMMRVVDVLYALPTMPLVILLVALYERSLMLLFLVIGFLEWLTMSRVVRGQTLALKKQDFVTAARAYGAGWWRILLRHLLPHVTGIVIVYASLTMPAVMMFEAVLSFLGFGVQPPDSSWGVMISEGAQSMQAHPWILIPPAVIFSITLLALSVMGDALRDAFDPRGSRDS
jgi:oligopeptide transport system permease protein